MNSPHSRSAAPLAGCWLLLVDDSETNRAVVVHLLERAGACVEVAEDGDEACAKVDNRIQQDAPHDLILMDLNMPRMDGFEATRLIRTRGFEGPIVATTAYGEASMHAGARSAGCDDVIVKPFKPREFLEAITALVHGEDYDPTQRQAATLNLDELPEIIPSEYAGDEDMIPLVEWFIDEVEDDASAIETALEAGDLEEVRVLSHRLKGAGGNYGFPGLTSVASVVEKRAAAADPGLKDGVAILVTVLRRLRAA